MWLVQITPMWYIVVLILDSEPAAKVEKPVGQTEGVEQLFRHMVKQYRVRCGTVGHTVCQAVGHTAG